MPHRDVSKRRRQFAKAMRSEMSTAEFRLWLRLRKPGIANLRFRRQALIGPYIVDFFCPHAKLIVEVDGDQHAQANSITADNKRDQWLEGQGYRIMRFWTVEIANNLDGVCDAIAAASRQSH